jgi:translation initiation factor 2 subunit 1
LKFFLKINLIAPPLYVVTATCLDRNEGLNALRKVIDSIKLGIEKYRGIFKIKMEPKVVTNVDEEALKVN